MACGLSAVEFANNALDGACEWRSSRDKVVPETGEFDFKLNFTSSFSLLVHRLLAGLQSGGN